MIRKGRSVSLPLPYWFSKERLEAIHKTIKDRAWLRGYEQEALHSAKNQIYYNWDEVENVRACRLDENLPLILSPDWNIGDVDYMAWVVMQDVPEETRVIGEIPMDNVSVRVAARMFMRLYPPHLPLHIYGDATGWSREPSLGSNCFTVLLQELEPWNEGGIEVFVHPYYDGKTRKLPRNPNRIDRHNSVNDRLLDNGIRRLFVDPKCERTIESVTLLEYKEGSLRESDNESVLGHTWVQIGYFLAKAYPAERPLKPIPEQPGRGEDLVEEFIHSVEEKLKPVDFNLGSEI